MQLVPRRWSCATMLALIGMPPAQAASTARAALKELNAAAQKWQPDAVLTHVSTLGARADGQAKSWLYNVCSAKARKSAIVTARDTKVEVKLK
jgi:isocitrate dehydrogenase